MSPFNDFLNKTNSYSFNNSWDIDAPLEHTWNELLNYKKWATWCDSLFYVASCHNPLKSKQISIFF